MTLSLDAARRSVERAQQQFQADQALLFDKTGKQIFSETEHKRRLAAMLAPLQAAVEVASEAAQATVAAATKETLKADLDYVLSLDTETLQRAAALKPFVSELVDKADMGALAVQLEAVGQHGDMATKFVYARVAAGHWDALLQRRRKGEQINTTGDSVMLEQLNSLTKQLVDPATTKAVAVAQQTMQDASELANYARKTLSEADGSAARAKQQWERQVRAW